MVPLDRFTVVPGACTLFPMLLVHDLLLTLAGRELFNPQVVGAHSCRMDTHSVGTTQRTKISMRPLHRLRRNSVRRFLFSEVCGG
jgi:hypothetical protein